MSETKHSPEPWKDDGAGAVQDADGYVVLWSSDLPYPPEDTQRRIVACVNACAGIPTEALEAGDLGRALDALVKYQRENQLHHDADFDRFGSAEQPLRALGKLP